MQPLPFEHPLAQLYNEHYLEECEITFHQSDEPVTPINESGRKLHRKRNGPTPPYQILLGTSASFLHEQMTLTVFQDLNHWPDELQRLTFFVAVSHPECETQWFISEDPQDLSYANGRTRAIIQHQKLGTNALHIFYDDKLSENRFKLNLVIELADSRGRSVLPSAVSESQLAELISF